MSVPSDSRLELEEVFGKPIAHFGFSPTEQDLVRHWLWLCDVQRERTGCVRLRDPVPGKILTKVAKNLVECWTDYGYKEKDLRSVKDVRKIVVRVTEQVDQKFLKSTRNHGVKEWRSQQRKLYSGVVNVFKGSMPSTVANNSDSDSSDEEVI